VFLIVAVIYNLISKFLEMVLKANTLKDPFRSSWNSRTILLQTRARNFKTTKRQFVKKSASVSLVISVLNIDLISDLITKLDFTSSEAHLATVSFISGVFTGLISQFSYGRSEKLRSSRGKLPSFSLNSSNRESLDSQAFVGSVLTPIDGNSVEQANWFNKIVAAAWPYLDEATSNAITRALDPILKATRPTFLTSLRFERFSFGSVPAIIQGVKVYDTQDRGAVEIDLEIFWAGDPDVVLGIRAANDTLNVPVSLTELQCAFKLRLIFAPLIGVFPCFGALTIALVEEPSLDFDLRVVGGDITLVPGISQPLRTYIKALIGSYLVWPRFITVPMPGTGYAVPKTSFKKSVPDGSLEITLNSRNGEYIGDEIGCQVSWQTNNIIENLEEIRFRTLIEPTESSSIQISVQDVLNQSLILNWYSRNSLEASHVVGQACIPLHELLKNVSGNLIRESSNIDLGDFVIEFENITKKNGASHDKSINEVVSNFSRVRNRFTKILPDVKEIRTPAVNPTTDSKIIQVRILYFPTSGTVNNK